MQRRSARCEWPNIRRQLVHFLVRRWISINLRELALISVLNPLNFHYLVKIVYDYLWATYRQEALKPHHRGTSKVTPGTCIILVWTTRAVRSHLQNIYGYKVDISYCITTTSLPLDNGGRSGRETLVHLGRHRTFPCPTTLRVRASAQQN